MRGQPHTGLHSYQLLNSQTGRSLPSDPHVDQESTFAVVECSAFCDLTPTASWSDPDQAVKLLADPPSPSRSWWVAHPTRRQDQVQTQGQDQVRTRTYQVPIQARRRTPQDRVGRTRSWRADPQTWSGPVRTRSGRSRSGPGPDRSKTRVLTGLGQNPPKPQNRPKTPKTRKTGFWPGLGAGGYLNNIYPRTLAKSALYSLLVVQPF